MKGQQLSPRSWKCAIKKCGETWRSMSKDERDPFNAKALEEQGLRENAAFEPLKSKIAFNCPEASGSAAEHLSRSAKKKIAKQRSVVTYQQFRNAKEWQEVEGGICTPDGALNLDLIDLEATEESLLSRWGQFAKPSTAYPKQWKGKCANVNGVHHTPCHAQFGVCNSNPLMDLVTKFVNNMATFVSGGASLLSFPVVCLCQLSLK